jgi:hypothetical protein
VVQQIHLLTGYEPVLDLLISLSVIQGGSHHRVVSRVYEQRRAQQSASVPDPSLLRPPPVEVRMDRSPQSGGLLADISPASLGYWILRVWAFNRVFLALFIVSFLGISQFIGFRAGLGCPGCTAASDPSGGASGFSRLVWLLLELVQYVIGCIATTRKRQSRDFSLDCLRTSGRSSGYLPFVLYLAVSSVSKNKINIKYQKIH